jgi:GAF domain-containing protein
LSVDPIPESVEAVEEFGPFEPELLQDLQDRARQVQDLVPDCVGVSVASQEHGMTVTVVATDAEIAALDGVQYVDHGPCVDAMRLQDPQDAQEYQHDMFEEAGWQLFAQATAASSIASTLTLPIVSGERVVGSVNLYAATARAFAGHHEEIAQIFGAWAPGAVTNADLDFSTRRTSQQAPQVLYEETRIQVAVGLLAAANAISVETAVAQLSDAARRAGVSEAAIAEKLISGVRDADPRLDD